MPEGAHAAGGVGAAISREEGSFWQQVHITQHCSTPTGVQPSCSTNPNTKLPAPAVPHAPKARSHEQPVVDCLPLVGEPIGGQHRVDKGSLKQRRHRCGRHSLDLSVRSRAWIVAGWCTTQEGQAAAAD